MGIFDQNNSRRYGYGSGNQGGNSPWGRIMMAIVIAVVAFFMYMSSSQENPITGEKQYVSLTPNEEIQLGLESAPQMAYQMGGEVSPSDPRSQEVQKIGQEIVDKTIAHKSPWKFNFHLLADDKTVNAFALPGGQIFITLGLYNKLENEAQLAGVLSHEIGHVIERHSAQQMAKSNLGQSLVIAVATGAGDGSGSSQPMMVAAVVNQMMQLRYGRADESEADTWGIKLMSQVGYDPRAMIDVMEILKAAGGGGGGPELFQSHPNPDLRIKQIKEYLQKHPSSNTYLGKNLKSLSKGSQKRETNEEVSPFDFFKDLLRQPQ